MLHKIQKRGQVAETVTWLVATILILIILSISVYTASVLSKTNRAVTISVEEYPILLKQSLYGFLFTRDTSGKRVFEQIEESGGLDLFSKDLGEKVFKDPSGEFDFSLKFDTKYISGSVDEEIRINKGTNLEVEASLRGSK